MTDDNTHHLPTTYSLFDAAALAKLLEETHGFFDVSCQLIKGTVRDIYRVTTGENRYILCIYRHGDRSIAEIEAELDFMDYLYPHGLVVPTAIRSQEGDRLLHLAAPEGERYAVVFTYVEGQQLSKTPEPAAMSQVGKVLARLHVASDLMATPLRRPQIDFDSLVRWSIAAFEVAAPQRVEDIAYLHEVAAQLEPHFHHFPTGKPHYGLVHGDMVPSNILTTGDGQPALVDFDSCSYGWWMYDLATLRVEIDYWNMGGTIWQAVLEGYQSARPILDEDFAMMPALTVARYMFSLGVPAWHINTWGQVYFADLILDKTLHLIRQAMKEIVR